MTPITLVYSYYNNGGMLERQCQEWARYDAAIKPNFSAVVIDDGSDVDPALGHLSDVGFPVALYRIVPNLIWNLAGARNLGMQQAADGWCLLTDIDHVLLADDAVRLVKFKTISGRYYLPARQWADGRKLDPHSNSYLLQKALYWAVGGCDEDYTGWWGGGEGPFRQMIRTIATRETTRAFTLTHFGRDDVADACTTEWGRKDSPYYWAKNPALLRKAKGRPYKPTQPIRFPWERVQ